MVHVREKWNSEMMQDQTIRDIEHATDTDDFWMHLALSASGDSHTNALQTAHAARHSGHPKVAVHPVGQILTDLKPLKRFL